MLYYRSLCTQKVCLWCISMLSVWKQFSCWDLYHPFSQVLIISTLPSVPQLNTLIAFYEFNIWVLWQTLKLFCSKRNNSNWSLYTLAMQPLFMHNASSNFSERILHKSICVFAHTCLQNDALLKTTCIIVVHSLVWAYCTVNTEQWTCLWKR